MDAIDFMRMASKARDEQAPKTVPPLSIEARRLLDHYADYTKVHTFQPGNLVKLKAGLRNNYRYPRDERPGVVCEILDPPLPADTSSPSSVGALLDIRIAVLDDDGDLVLFCYPSQLFEPYDGPVEP